MFTRLLKNTSIRKVAISFALLSPAMMPALTYAQSAPAAPLSTIIPLTFTGTVTTSPDATITIRQADGSSVPYTGPLPANAPLQEGQSVTITMNATVPTQAYFAQQAAAGATVPADGIYHFKLNSLGGVTSNGQQVTGLTPGVLSGYSATGPMGQANSTSIALVYNANTGSYALDNGGSFADSQVAGTGFTYDPSTGKVGTCQGIACSSSTDNYAAFALAGNSDGTGISGLYTYVVDSLGNIVGNFKLGITGSWNLPDSSSFATAVPEPGMAALFGIGVMVPVLRRRRAARAKG